MWNEFDEYHGLILILNTNKSDNNCKKTADAVQIQRPLLKYNYEEPKKENVFKDTLQARQ